MSTAFSKSGIYYGNDVFHNNKLNISGHKKMMKNELNRIICRNIEIFSVDLHMLKHIQEYNILLLIYGEIIAIKTTTTANRMKAALYSKEKMNNKLR